MTQSAEISHLNRLPLHQQHKMNGARFGAFGAWYVPLYFSSILEEHQIVRSGVGVFDISHMGEFFIRGKDAQNTVNQWIVNDLRKISVGGALYSPVCNDAGGIVDDVIVYMIGPEEFMMVVNAANISKDYTWFESHLSGKTKLEDKSSAIALLSVQGPQSRALVSELFSIDLSKLSYYHFQKFDSKFGDIFLAETGYTGEAGFEIFCPVSNVGPLWERLFQVGRSANLKPIGFGARDTLRLESRFLLYGHDMNDETTPLEASLAWTIGWNKDSFIGKDVLSAQKERGISRKLIGFEVRGRGIAREGCSFQVSGRDVGMVTSGTFAPTLKKNIGLGYIQTEYAQTGQTIDIKIRDKLVTAEVVKTPFYKRHKK
jgi:aminomethyltransferase